MSQAWVLSVLGFLPYTMLKTHIKPQQSLPMVSGASCGLPQPSSFGPNMRLAKRLLLKNEKETVLEFLDLTENFWAHGAKCLQVWRVKINDGKQPNCLKHIFKGGVKPAVNYQH